MQHHHCYHHHLMLCAIGLTHIVGGAIEMTVLLFLFTINNTYKNQNLNISWKQPTIVHIQEHETDVRRYLQRQADPSDAGYY